jgi:hypothetical protein
MAQPWLFWIGVAMLPLGAIVGKAMAMAGMGQPQKDGANTTGSTSDSAHA